MKNLKVGQILKEGRFEVEVVSISDDKFDVQYISGVCLTYRQADLDNNTLTTFIG